jgi:DNA-binding MarR family transcriptional regulator
MTTGDLLIREPLAPESDTVDEMLAQWGRQRPDLDSSGMAVVLRVLLLSGVFAQRLKGVLAPAGLAPFEYDVLSALRRAGRGVSPKELCRSAQLSSGAMTYRIDRLEERGLVRRRTDPQDRRGIAVELTSRGLALVEGILGARMADAAESLRPLTRREVRELARLLRIVSKSLEEPQEVR